MTRFVLDASIALSWCFADEASEATDLILDRLRETGALVPPLWFSEVGNALLQAERRGRITAPDVAVRLELISALPVFVDQNGVGRAWNEVLALARSAQLTAYDAAYLELAQYFRIPLATRDRALAAAARRLDVEVLPHA